MGRHGAGRVPGAEAAVTVTSAGDAELEPAELEALLAAFHHYEAALMTDDVEVLDRSFAPGPDTVRGDANGLLVGHERISAFRSVRGGVARRTITSVRVRVLSPSAALLVSVSAFVAGGAGLQTQLWERVGDGEPRHDGGARRSGRWVISAAHVTGVAPALNRAVWRVAGTPLVPPLPVEVGAADAGRAGVGTDAGGVAGGDASGGPRVLEGMTVAVKDLFAVGGFAIGAGVPEYLAGAEVEAADADAVAALREAGAAVQGIAQTDEFAYSVAGRNVHYGTPQNPAVPGAIPGGSSSGPASAVALGQATIGLGTDTGGSIRVPASYQGLWGLRTTHGAVSARGLLPLAPSFDTVGWLTRSAAALRAAAAATLGDSPERPGQRELAPRFAVSRDIVASCEPAVRDAFDALLASPVFAGDGGVPRESERGGGERGGGPRDGERGGGPRDENVPADPRSNAQDDPRAAGVVEVELGDLDAVFAAFRVVQGAEAWRQHGEWVEAHPGVLGPDIAERFDIASAVSAEAEEEARAVLAEARARFDSVLEGRILLLPSASSAAPALTATPDDIQAVRAATLRMTSVAGTGGYPAVSAPLLRVPEPVGLCFVGPRGSDLPLLDLAATLAAALDTRP